MNGFEAAKAEKFDADKAQRVIFIQNNEVPEQLWGTFGKVVGYKRNSLIVERDDGGDFVVRPEHLIFMREEG